MGTQNIRRATPDTADERLNLEPAYHDVNRPTRRRLKIGGIEERTGVHRQTIWRWYKAGLFPPPHYLGSERQWFEDEIISWENERMAQRAEEKGAA